MSMFSHALATVTPATTATVTDPAARFSAQDAETRGQALYAQLPAEADVWLDEWLDETVTCKAPDGGDVLLTLATDDLAAFHGLAPMPEQGDDALMPHLVLIDLVTGRGYLIVREQCRLGGCDVYYADDIFEDVETVEGAPAT